MSRLLVMLFIYITVISCFSTSNDTFNNNEIVSSKGEKIYINTLNWGITDDYQRSAISVNKDKIKERSDTSETIKGLEPFFYSFKGDTLSLYFDDTINYRLQDNLKTIHVNYVLLDNEQYQEVRLKAYNNQENYYCVPIRNDINYPLDMPLPPKIRK